MCIKMHYTRKISSMVLFKYIKIKKKKTNRLQTKYKDTLFSDLETIKV